MASSTAQCSQICHCEEAIGRRGNLAVPGRITGRPRRKRSWLQEIPTSPNYYCNTCDCLWRSLSAATDAIGAYHFTLTSMGRKCLPEIATGAKRPRNDTSGSAKVHQRPCTVELPRTGRSGSAAAIRPASWCGRWSGRKFVSRARGNNEDLRRQGNAVSAFP